MRLTLGKRAIKLMKEDLNILDEVISSYKNRSPMAIVQEIDLKNFKRYRNGIKDTLSYYGITI